MDHDPGSGQTRIARTRTRFRKRTTAGAAAQEGTMVRYPRWPVALLAGSAFVAIWGGWVELGRMSGFGPVNLLPGIADLEVDLSITLPLGMEVYAAFALGAWLTSRPIPAGARNFARWSAILSLIVGAGGQIAYHLLAAAGVDEAPWQVVVVVACIPVAVLGLASALLHQLGKGEEGAGRAVGPTNQGAATTEPHTLAHWQEADPGEVAPHSGSTSHLVTRDSGPDHSSEADPDGPTEPDHTNHARAAWTTPDERTAEVIRLWATEGEPAGRRISHQEIADRVGTSKSTVTRTLNRHLASVSARAARVREDGPTTTQTPLVAAARED